MFEVLFGGAETTVQDIGRFGRYRYAICPSGAQDNFSFRVGNIILKNKENDAALEVTAIGPRMRVQKTAVIAIVGADLTPSINGQVAAMWAAVRVNRDDLISFGEIRSGCRSYVCVAGGIDVPLVFGSRSTGILNKIGGFEGRRLRQGDVITTFSPQFPVDTLEGHKLPSEYIPYFRISIDLRIITGCYEYRLTSRSREELFTATWTVGTNSNKVAYYFNGPELQFEPDTQPFGAGSNPSNVVDIAYPIGSVQVPGGKHPVLLLNDGVTGGGFNIIGTVVRADLDIAGQLKPGDQSKFKRIGIEEALRIRKEKEDKIMAIKSITRYPF